jgi:hypothetical protein
VEPPGDRRHERHLRRRPARRRPADEVARSQPYGGAPTAR